MIIVTVALYIFTSGAISLLIEDRLSKSSHDMLWGIIKGIFLLSFCYSAPFVAWKFFNFIGMPNDLFLKMILSASCFFVACIEMAVVGIIYDAFSAPQKETPLLL